MRLIEPHIHMYTRTTDDYQMMAISGIEAVVEPSFWSGTDRSSPSSFEDYFRHLLTFERQRAKQVGIDHYTAIGLNPKEANNIGLAREVLTVVESYLNKPPVVAVGEIGFDLITPQEEEIFTKQLQMAKDHNMPVIIHSPHQNKLEGIKRILPIVKELNLPIEKVLVDHNTEETIKLTLEAGVWAGLTVYPISKLTVERAVNIIKQVGTERMMVNGSADWGISDPLSVPKTAWQMRLVGFSSKEVHQVVFANPVSFFSQSPNFSIEAD